MSVTDGIGQTPCSLEHYLVQYVFTSNFGMLSRRAGLSVTAGHSCLTLFYDSVCLKGPHG